MIKKSILAGGCFWGMEDLIRKVDGVLNTTVGYCGGQMDNPTYLEVKTGTTNHAEAIEIEYDDSKLSYADLLRFFFKIHDPTTVDRQGNDRGTQYRSAIFIINDEERKVAQEIIAEVDNSGKWGAPIVTKIEELKKFYPAEEYHQDYLEKNPGGYTCHWIRK